MSRRPRGHAVGRDHAQADATPACESVRARPAIDVGHTQAAMTFGSGFRIAFREAVGCRGPGTAGCGFQLGASGNTTCIR